MRGATKASKPYPIGFSGNYFGDHLKYLLGAFGSWDDGAGAQQSIDAVELSYMLGGDPAISDHQGLSNTTKTWAIFTQEDVRFTKQWSVTLGARYTQETIGQILSNWNYNPTTGAIFCNGNTAEPTNDPGPYCSSLPEATGPNGSYQHATSNGVSYLASINYQMTGRSAVLLQHGQRLPRRRVRPLLSSAGQAGDRHQL